MKLTPVGKVRIAIMLALSVCEMAGLIYFYRHPGLAEFAFLSLMGMSFIIGLLWADWNRHPAIRAVGTLIAPCFCLMGMRCWNVGDHVSGVALAAVPLLGVLRAYPAMVYRPNPWSQAQQEAFFENIGFKNSFGTIFAFVLSRPSGIGPITRPLFGLCCLDRLQFLFCASKY
jgi:hypothetical protein